jgi:hypothetical protein
VFHFNAFTYILEYPIISILLYLGDKKLRYVFILEHVTISNQQIL